jgi:hypothetical protein
MTHKKGNGVLLATTKSMGHEARTATTKDMTQEETKEVLVVKTRRRESSCSESKLKNSITTVNIQGTAMTKTRGARSLLEATINKQAQR